MLSANLSVGEKRRYSGIAAEASAPSVRVAYLPCCLCGTLIQPNQSNICINCLKGEVDICAGISRNSVLEHCRECSRYKHTRWEHCELESRKLLGICLKKVKGINVPGGAKLVDASWIWTEPHSKRLKIKLTVQKEVSQGAVMQQNLVVEFVLQSMQCDDCKRTYTPHTWNSVVQVRQKTDHKRTFFYLEQLILKHEAHEKVVGLKNNPDGLDFHFGHRSHAQRFADFVSSCFPTKTKMSKHLISHDAHSNTYNYKYTIFCEICPVSKDDLVYLPKDLARKLGGIPRLMQVAKVSTQIHLVDPTTARTAELAAVDYWKHPFTSILTKRHLVEFTVLNSEALGQLTGRGKNPLQLCDLELARTSDLGVNDDRITVRSHLGRLLQAGDLCLAFDLRTVNVGGVDDECLAKIDQDVLVARKTYRRSARRAARRTWQVRRLAEQPGMLVEADGKGEAGILDPMRADDEDMEEFKRELEEDKDLRGTVHLYRKNDLQQQQASGDLPQQQLNDSAADESEDDDAPMVELGELLEGLTLNAAATAAADNGQEKQEEEEEDEEEEL